MKTGFRENKVNYTVFCNKKIQSIRCADSLACFVYLQMLMQSSNEAITNLEAVEILNEKFDFNIKTPEECLIYLFELGVFK